VGESETVSSRFLSKALKFGVERRSSWKILRLDWSHSLGKSETFLPTREIRTVLHSARAWVVPSLSKVLVVLAIIGCLDCSFL
jgi:hypothetical protein